tara:strand:- start:188 stop:445 length:258 start_codon:yes stop_codon:yes gene_type:complete
MDLIWLKLPTGIYYILTIFGCYSFFHLLNFLFLNVKSYLKYKRFHRSLTEEKLYFLYEENKVLKEKIEKLEDEIDELTKQIINKL